MADGEGGAGRSGRGRKGYEPTDQRCPRCKTGRLLRRLLRKYLGSYRREALQCDHPECRWRDVRDLE